MWASVFQIVHSTKVNAHFPAYMIRTLKGSHPKPVLCSSAVVRNPRYGPAYSSLFCFLLHFRCGTRNASPKIRLKQAHPAALHPQPQQNLLPLQISHSMPHKKSELQMPSFVCVSAEIFSRFLHGTTLESCVASACRPQLLKITDGKRQTTDFWEQRVQPRCPFPSQSH